MSAARLFSREQHIWFCDWLVSIKLIDFYIFMICFGTFPKQVLGNTKEVCGTNSSGLCVTRDLSKKWHVMCENS